ncbi:MAG: DUF4327 family protein [Phormidesmis sp.]
MTNSTAVQPPSTLVATHPMEKFQRKVRSLVETKAISPTDNLWKIAFIFGDKWPHWKAELESFDFTMQDTIGDLLVVDSWEEADESDISA